MRSPRHYLRPTLSAAALLLTAVWVYHNMAGSHSDYRCDVLLAGGSMTGAGQLFIELETYGAWVELFTGSNASILLESADRSSEYFPRLRQVDDQYQIVGDGDRLIGSFLPETGLLLLDTEAGTLKAQCALAHGAAG